MKASFCTRWIADTQEEMEQAIPELARMGYDGLEFWEQYLSDTDLGWIKGIMDEHHLEVVQICPYTEQWNACVKGLQRICDIGKPHGIVFPLETHQVIHSGPNLTDTSATTLRLLEDVGRHNLKVNLQTPLLGESVFYSAEQLGEHVVHLHAHNWIRSWPNLTFLDSGDVDFSAFVRILQDKDFDGYISIEHGDHHPPYETAAHEIQYLKRLIGGELWGAFAAN